MNNLLEYNLFIFDFDGTIIDSEKTHYKSWIKAISTYNNISHSEVENNMTFSDYFKIFHSLDKDTPKKYMKFIHSIDDYDSIYIKKQENYNEYIKNNDIPLINGIEQFLNFLINNNKDFIIVSNTSNKFIEIYKLHYPILNKALEIYTKENFINRKPNPECYLHIVNKYKNTKKIGFEDSLVGVHALYQVNDITPVFINNSDYYYKDYILNNYNNILKTSNYNIFKLNDDLINNNSLKLNRENDNSFIDSILSNNITELKNNFSNMSYIIKQITTLLKYIPESNNIYLSGMGKSGYVCKKCASTWQSLSIKCSYIDLPNLPHGDFGTFRDNDILLLISNNGNTDEIIYILKYLKSNLNKKITTISIVANENSKMEELSDFTYILNTIKESDSINMTPSTSSLIFMALLDGIAVNLKKDITKDEFKLCHPSGSLGKKN